MTSGRQATERLHDNPRSAYIHIPFCRHRCGYCNFSLVAGRDYLVDRFLSALEREISGLPSSYQLQTLFLGGGTPSHLTPGQLQELRRIVLTRFEFAATAEVSAECNPNDLTEEKAEALATFGVNRVSLGVQSLNPQKLFRLDRDHSPEEVTQAVKLSRQFAHSVSLDLIFAAPEETPEDWQQELNRALGLKPDHISTYELTYEKGTRFWNHRLHQRLDEAEEDLRAEMYRLAIETLELAGLAQYEISSFAKPGHRCQHNEVYWTGASYFAFGPGASRYIAGFRQTNHQSTLHYLKSIERGESPVAVSEKLAPRDSAKERLAIGLRRVAGIRSSEFFQQTGFKIQELMGRNWNDWLQQGLLIRENDRVALSRQGRFLADGIATRILSD